MAVAATNHCTGCPEQVRETAAGLPPIAGGQSGVTIETKTDADGQVAERDCVLRKDRALVDIRRAAELEETSAAREIVLKQSLQKLRIGGIVVTRVRDPQFELLV